MYHRKTNSQRVGHPRIVLACQGGSTRQIPSPKPSGEVSNLIVAAGIWILVFRQEVVVTKAVRVIRVTPLHANPVVSDLHGSARELSVSPRRRKGNASLNLLTFDEFLEFPPLFSLLYLYGPGQHTTQSNAHALSDRVGRRHARRLRTSANPRVFLAPRDKRSA